MNPLPGGYRKRRVTGKSEEYISKKVTNSMNMDKYRENDTYFDENLDRHKSLEEMLEHVKAREADIIHIIDYRWTDEIEELKKLGKPIVYCTCRGFN